MSGPIGDNTARASGVVAAAAAAGADTFWNLTKDGNTGSITDATWTKVSTWTSVVDSDSAWDNTNNKIVIPSGKGGKYLVSLSMTQSKVSGANTHADTYLSGIYKNGSLFQLGWGQTEINVLNGTSIYTGILDLSATDYLEAYAYCSGGGGSSLVMAITEGVAGTMWSGAKLA